MLGNVSEAGEKRRMDEGRALPQQSRFRRCKCTIIRACGRSHTQGASEQGSSLNVQPLSQSFTGIGGVSQGLSSFCMLDRALSPFIQRSSYSLQTTALREMRDGLSSTDGENPERVARLESLPQLGLFWTHESVF